MIQAKRHNPIWFYYVVLFAGIVCIGWSAVFVKLSAVDGLSSAFYRMFFGFVGVIPIWLFRRKNISDWTSVKFALISGLIFAFDIAVWNISILLTKASISTLLANLAPVWVGIGSIIFLREQPGRLFWIGTTVSLIGVSLIVGIEKITAAALNTGHILAVVASLFYATYLLVMRKGRVSLDTVSFTAISMFASSLLLFGICFFTSTPLTGFTTEAWGSLIGLGLISQLGGWLAINYALGYIKSTTASVALLAQTIVTAVIALFLLGETLSLIEIVGMIIVLLGIYLVTRKKLMPKTKIDPEY